MMTRMVFSRIHHHENYHVSHGSTVEALTPWEHVEATIEVHGPVEAPLKRIHHHHESLLEAHENTTEAEWICMIHA